MQLAGMAAGVFDEAQERTSPPCSYSRMIPGGKYRRRNRFSFIAAVSTTREKVA